MSNESKIYDDRGRLISVRHVSEHNGGHRVTDQVAWKDPLGENRTSIINDRDVYPDGSEYHHNGRRIR